MLTTKMIGNKIADARKKTMLSQAELAQQLFISSQAVGKWERGESLPDIITLNRLAEILGVDLNYFSDSTGMNDTVKASEVWRDIEADDICIEDDIQLPLRKPKKIAGWDMSKGNWVDADFSGIKNLHEKFSNSNMQRCLFRVSDLSGLVLRGNHVDRCDFSGSDAGNSKFQNAYLANNQFQECLLNETEFTGSYVMGCDFTGADFTGAVLKSGGFENNLISGAKWNGTSFESMHLIDIIFDGIIEDCSFENCSFKKVRFENATLVNTFFKNRNLKGVRFINCTADTLSYAFLKNGKADLTGISIMAS